MPEAWAGLIAAHQGMLLKPQGDWSAAETEAFWVDLVTNAQIYEGLCGYSRKMLSDWDLAADAVQETLASLSTRLTYEPSRAGAGGVRGWVFRSLHNRITASLRFKWQSLNFVDVATLGPTASRPTTGRVRPQWYSPTGHECWSKSSGSRTTVGLRLSSPFNDGALVYVAFIDPEHAHVFETLAVLRAFGELNVCKFDMPGESTPGFSGGVVVSPRRNGPRGCRGLPM
jgi:hypothetical protein